MKNRKIKPNKTKIVARVMLVFVIILSIVLISCSLFVGDVNEVVHIKDFNSHSEFYEFVQVYNSKSDADISSFISFDFDDNSFFDTYYRFRARAPHNTKDLYDKNTIDTNIELFFYLDKDSEDNENIDLEYKIKCSYAKPKKIFSCDDTFEIKLLGKNEVSGEYIITALDYQDERLSADENNKKYTCAYSLVLLINGEIEMSIKISSTRELDEEALNSITKVLLENMVIIGQCDGVYTDVDNIVEDNLEILFGSHTPTNEPTLYQSQYYATHYFNNLSTNYGDNYMGSCSYVSLAMLLAYYDSYWDDSIIGNNNNYQIYDETSEFTTIEPLSSVSSPGIKNDEDLHVNKLAAINAVKPSDEKQNELTFTQYYEVVEDNSHNYFHLKLIELGRVSKICEIYEFFDINPYGLGRLGRQNLIDYYLYTYRNFESENIWYECVTTNVEEYIVDNVSQGIPVLIAVAYADGGGHALIVYDYDQNTGKLYGHMGWGSNLTHIDLSSMGYLYIKNAATIRINTNHSHSDNYVDSLVNGYCSCYFPVHPEHVCTYTDHNDFSTYQCGCSANGVGSTYHIINYTNSGDSGHRVECDFCGYVSTEEHCLEYSNSSDSTHIASCTECDYTTTTSHNYRCYGTLGPYHSEACVDCGYAHMGLANIPYTSIDENSHVKTCPDCGYSTEAQSHTFAYRNLISQGHEKYCVDCGYTSAIVAHDYNSNHIYANTTYHRSYCECGASKLNNHIYEIHIEGQLKLDVCVDCRIERNHVHEYTYTPCGDGKTHHTFCGCGISQYEQCFGMVGDGNTGLVRCLKCNQRLIGNIILPLDEDGDENDVMIFKKDDLEEETE